MPNDRLFERWSPLSRALETLKSQARQAVGALSPEQLTEEREAETAQQLMRDFASGVKADTDSREATTFVDQQSYGSAGPTTYVRYHIPASGQLNLLKHGPEGADVNDVAASVVRSHGGLLPRLESEGRYSFSGEIVYDISAAAENHKEIARQTAETIEKMVGLLNEQLAAFRAALEPDILAAIRQRREREARAASTIADLDVPLRDK